nr:F-box domain, leucine-rich repeat domain, L domain-like protein [Tanacetum cinerariifolium]
MPSGKSKKSKKDGFSIYMHYGGIFITSHLTYAEGSSREINDVNFDDMSLQILYEIVRKLILGGSNLVKRLYYCKTDTSLSLGIKELLSDLDVEAMLNAGYDNGNQMDFYVEHYDFDVMSFINLEPSLEQSLEDNDDYDSDNYEDIKNVDYQNEADDNVVIKDFTTPDPFLNKLSTRAVFRASTSRQQVSVIGDIPKEDPDNAQIDMWYMKNDWRSVLVFCGKNVQEGRCARKKGKKNRPIPKTDRSVEGIVEKVLNDSGEGTSKQVKRSKVKKVKKVRKGKKVKKVQNKQVVDNFGRLFLDSNPRSTCRLDVDESNTSRTFKRIYISFKGVKDGWLAGCRKVIGLNGCFLKHTYDLALNDGTCITIISDSHKAQFKAHIDNIRQINQQAYEYLVARDPNSWSRAFFEMDRRCAAFENDISESFNRAILDQRSKPIITMLEEIRLYITHRLFQMNKVAFSLEATITPSIRKRLEALKEKQRFWIVYPSGFKELEVRCGDDSFGVNLQHKKDAR